MVREGAAKAALSGFMARKVRDMTTPKKTKKTPYWVGFDLGGTKMMATVYDGGFKPLASAKAKTP